MPAEMKQDSERRAHDYSHDFLMKKAGMTRREAGIYLDKQYQKIVESNKP